MGAMDFENISPEALRQYQQQNEEGDYQLIDVAAARNLGILPISSNVSGQ